MKKKNIFTINPPFVVWWSGGNITEARKFARRLGMKFEGKKFHINIEFGWKWKAIKYENNK